MPLDASIPYEALRGLQKAEPFDPMAFQARLQRQQGAQQGPNAAMMRYGQEQQENQEIAAIAQQYGDDYDEMGKAIIARFPHRADVVGGIQTALKDGAAKHLAMTVEARAKLQSRLAEVQGADATTWEPVTQDIVKEFPQLSPLFAGRPYSPELQQQIVGIGQSQDQWLDAQGKAAQSLLDGKKQEGAARLIVAADTPPKQQELKGLLAQAGWTKFLGVMPDAASAQAYLDKQAEEKPEKSATVGSFEDYMTADPAHRAQILKDRKAYNQADDKARAAGGAGGGGSIDTPVLKPGTAYYRTAQDMAYGKLTFSQVRTLMAYNRNAGLKVALYDTARQINPNFNPAAFEMGYKYAGNPKTQNTLVSIDNALSNFDKAVELSEALDRFDYPTVNRWLAAGKFQMGGKAVTNLEQFRTILGDDVALAIGQGAPSDYKTKLAQSLVQSNLSKENFVSTLKQTGEFLMNRKNAILRQEGPYGEAGFNPSASAPVPKVMGGGPQEGQEVPLTGPGYPPGAMKKRVNGQWIRTK